MNSGLPGSPCKRGPPRQAYQNVLMVPSARRLTERFIPLSRTRTLCHPEFKRSAGCGTLVGCDDDDLACCWLNLKASYVDAFGLGDAQRSPQVGLPFNLAHETLHDRRTLRPPVS